MAEVMNPSGSGLRRALPLLLPAYVWLVIAIFLPLSAMVFFSFMSDLPMTGRDWSFTLANYQAFFSTGIYITLLGSSLRLGLEVTFWCLLIGFPATDRLRENDCFAHLLAEGSDDEGMGGRKVSSGRVIPLIVDGEFEGFVIAADKPDPGPSLDGVHSHDVGSLLDREKQRDIAHRDIGIVGIVSKNGVAEFQRFSRIAATRDLVG